MKLLIDVEFEVSRLRVLKYSFKYHVGRVNQGIQLCQLMAVEILHLEKAI